MPWNTDEDVAKHKKGLDSKKSAQWRRIANSVLAKCIKNGGTEESCAVSAIKQANGVVNTNSLLYSTYKNKQEGNYEVQLKVHQEKAHLVVPVVMMVEGVHNGSHGPLLHKIEDLGKFPEAWNGIPVVIDHPEENGVNVSANSPEIIDMRSVGKVYNTSVEDKKLKAEVWLDEEKLNTIAPETLADINNNKLLEVSLGVFTEEDDTPGVYNDENYDSIARNHRPDHLALLTEAAGACSIEDGCGLGVNEKDKKMAKLVNVEKTIKQLNSEGYSVYQILNNADQGYQEKMQMVNDALRKLDKSSSKDGEYVYNYLEEMYDDSIIYRSSGNGESKLYKQSYEIKNGNLNLTGTPKLVQKKVDYVNTNEDIQPSQNLGKAGVGVGNRIISRNNFKKEDKKMSENKCPKCVEKINALIANAESGFVEADREWLDTLSEPALDKITPKVIEKVVEKPVEVNKFTPEQAEALAYGEKQLKERRELLTKGILDNTEKGIWTDERLKVMELDVLEGIFKSVKKEEVGNYSARGGITVASEAVEALYPAGVVIDEPKK